jgi:hypothetical protein
MELADPIVEDGEKSSMADAKITDIARATSTIAMQQPFLVPQDSLKTVQQHV